MDTAEIIVTIAGLADKVAAVRDNWRRWRTTAAARAEAEAALAQARRDEDYLRHAVAELKDIDPKPGEDAELTETRRLLSNREKVLEAAHAAGQITARVTHRRRGRTS